MFEQSQDDNNLDNGRLHVNNSRNTNKMPSVALSNRIRATNDNNNNSNSNGNDKLMTNTNNPTTNGVHIPTMPTIIKPKLTTYFEVFTDFSWFIISSIGFIVQELYFMVYGYPVKSLAKDIALITGGGNGLGRLLAMRLSKLGAKVVIWDINKTGMNETTEMIQQLGGFCQGYVVDISNRDEVYKAAAIVQRDIGDISLLVNNAGVVSGTHLLETPDHLIERSFNVNVMAHFWTTKAFLPKMLENRVGHVVTIASLAGHVGITKLVDYCASKFAAVGFDEALRLELEVLGYKKIKTTCICPFFIQQTGMFDDVYARWVSTLNPNDVADRIITAIQRNEKIAIIPGFMKYLLALKWMFPWGCTAGLLKRLVPDASPDKTPLINQKFTAANVLRNNESSHTYDGVSPSSLAKAKSLLIEDSTIVTERVH